MHLDSLQLNQRRLRGEGTTLLICEGQTIQDERCLRMIAKRMGKNHSNLQVWHRRMVSLDSLLQVTHYRA